MQTRSRNLFVTIRTEGGLLPADLLQRVASEKRGLEGMAPEAYHLLPGEKLNEAISRAWVRLRGAWEPFRAALEKLPTGDPGTSATRERWLLRLFGELGYGRLQTAKSLGAGGKEYAVSHGWNGFPIHLVGWFVNLDQRAAHVPGAARTSPHGLMQELLNRSDAHLWGFVSNGRRLRILRDSKSLTRQSFVEFDLESMMEGEVYADFVLLWLLCHQSRIEAERPERCWLEQWHQTAQEQGTRALDQLRVGVEQAIAALGSGFLKHPANAALKASLRSGQLDRQEYYRQLLRVVYRLLFLFVAEDRDLLLAPDASPEARERYLKYYSAARLRRLSERQRGTRHGDLYHGLRLVMERLGSDEGCAALGLPALGSFLFSARAVAGLDGAEIANADLLQAIRALAFTRDGSIRRAVDYKNLRTEELGSVYELLLEIHPEMNVDAGTFALKRTGGSERKTTGSYYTHDSLVQCLLDSALDPVLDEAVKKPDPKTALLALKVCDPACGSGHFLIGAAHRIARRLASVRTGDEEPSPDATRHALRDVIGNCIYGVDINEMTVELCKVALWMEALEPGKPLSFLEHHIQCGNSLLGATPVLAAKGIPNAAFEPIAGDDADACAEFRLQNQDAHSGQLTLSEILTPCSGSARVEADASRIQAISDAEIAGVHGREQAWERLVMTPDYVHDRQMTDAWCAAFVWKKRQAAGGAALTQDAFRALDKAPETVDAAVRGRIVSLQEQYQFLHWHLAFPDVFHVPDKDKGETADNKQTGWSGGFDVVLGNPPWERIKLQEKEWFAARRPAIAKARNAAARRRMIANLKEEDPALYAAFEEARREAEGMSHLVRNSDRFPLCGRGDINTYTIFAETARTILNPHGRAGIIVPTGIATDDTTKYFFGDLVKTRTLQSLFGFKNERFLFPKPVEHTVTFGLLTMLGSALQSKTMEFCWNVWTVEEMNDSNRRLFLTADDIIQLNPNTRTCPVFRTQRDADLTKSIYRRVPVLVQEYIEGEQPYLNPWGVRLGTMFHMSNASDLFRDESGKLLLSRGDEKDTPPAEMLRPLYEAKMLHHFDHRWATYDTSATSTSKPTKRNVQRDNEESDDEDGDDVRDLTTKEKADSRQTVKPRYWIAVDDVNARLKKFDKKGALVWEWKRYWMFGFRDICRSTDVRTVIASLLPRVGAGNKIPLIFPHDDSPSIVACLYATLCAFVFDYAARQKMGSTTLNFFIFKQLPVLQPAIYTTICPLLEHGETWQNWILPRVLELTYTAWDIQSFALDCGYAGPPYVWDEERRFLLRCELDAAYFLLYGIERDDVDYIMDTFHVVKQRDEETFFEYRTKRVILSIYDHMQAAMKTSVPYHTLLDPPPAISAALPVSSEEALPDAPPAPSEDALADAPELVLVYPPSGPLTLDFGRIINSATASEAVPSAVPLPSATECEAAIQSLLVARSLRRDLVEELRPVPISQRQWRPEPKRLHRVRMAKQEYGVQELARVPLQRTFRRANNGPLSTTFYEAEDFAVARGWITRRDTGKHGVEYGVGPRIEEAIHLAYEVLGDRAQEVEDMLFYLDDDTTLFSEQWMTVHKVWQDLQSEGKPADFEAVFVEVAAWKPERFGFTRYNVRIIYDDLRERGYLR